MDFVANFMENTTVKKSLKLANICHSHERMYSGTVFSTRRVVTFDSCAYNLRNTVAICSPENNLSRGFL